MVRRLMGYAMVGLCMVFQSCLQQQPVKRLEELKALEGKTTSEVLAELGKPRVIDSSDASGERIWGYYQVMIRSEVDAKPRQRTVLVVLRKHADSLRVDQVRVP